MCWKSTRGGWELEPCLALGCWAAGPPWRLSWCSSMQPQDIHRPSPWRLEYIFCEKQGKTCHKCSAFVAFVHALWRHIDREGVQASGTSRKSVGVQEIPSVFLPFFLPFAPFPSTFSFLPLLLFPPSLPLSLPWKEPIQRLEIPGRSLGRRRVSYVVETSQKKSPIDCRCSWQPTPRLSRLVALWLPVPGPRKMTKLFGEMVDLNNVSSKCRQQRVG